MLVRISRVACLALLLAVSMGARTVTPNFVIETADARLCQQLAQTAEKCRREIAIAWLGAPMPNWASPCVCTVQAGPNLGAGGATTFLFDRGEVYGWRMTIQGSAQRLLDSVLPHEITHMVLASYFRQAVPRWADEGAATCAEHISEREKHSRMLVQFLQTGRGIAFNRMVAMKEYPKDVMPLYAQGYSLTEYLIQRGGKPKFLLFVADGMKDNRWSQALQRHYGVNDLGALQNTWVAWVGQGSPPLAPSPTTLAAVPSPRPRPEPNLILRMPKADPLGSLPDPVPPTGWVAAGTHQAAAAPVEPPAQPVQTQVTHPQPVGP